MPKELTHIVMADNAGKKFSELKFDHDFSMLLKDYRDYYLFGAIMHDIAFCAPADEPGLAVKDKGMLVHGTPFGNTMLPLIYLAREYDRSEKKSILAMIAGAVTHIITDCTFHPFVYYYTGDEIERHYRLEAIIDCYFFQLQKVEEKQSVSTLSIYNNLKSEFGELSKIVTGFLGLTADYETVLLKALKMHKFTLSLFRSRPGYFLFVLISLFATKPFKTKSRLFYPAGMKFNSPFLDSKFEYLHPVTGEKNTGSLESFSKKIAVDSSEMFLNIAKAAEETKLEELFKNIQPLSLETGLDVSIAKEFNHTDLTLTIDALVTS